VLDHRILKGALQALERRPACLDLALETEVFLLSAAKALVLRHSSTCGPLLIHALPPTALVPSAVSSLIRSAV
jgi:hypothetical protein